MSVTKERKDSTARAWARMLAGDLDPSPALCMPRVSGTAMTPFGSLVPLQPASDSEMLLERLLSASKKYLTGSDTLGTRRS